MTLLELQRRMLEDVCRPLTDDFTMQADTPEGASMHEVAASYITHSARQTPFERLEIYNRSYWFRAFEAVADDFPALRVVLGNTRFNALVLAYLAGNPSRSWTLRNLSSQMPQWLAANPAYAGRMHRLALDIAKLEWAYIEAFDSRSEPPLSAEEIQAIAPDDGLSLQPHLQLLQLSYPVDDLVLAVHRELPEREMVSNTSLTLQKHRRAKLPSLPPQVIYLAVHRFHDSVYYRRIDQSTFRLLVALRDGGSMAEALTRFFEQYPGQNPGHTETQLAHIQPSFALASELGWICRRASSE